MEETGRSASSTEEHGQDEGGHGQESVILYRISVR